MKCVLADVIWIRRIAKNIYSGDLSGHKEIPGIGGYLTSNLCGNNIIEFSISLYGGEDTGRNIKVVRVHICYGNYGTSTLL